MGLPIISFFFVIFTILLLYCVQLAAGLNLSAVAKVNFYKLFLKNFRYWGCCKTSKKGEQQLFFCC